MTTQSYRICFHNLSIWRGRRGSLIFKIKASTWFRDGLEVKFVNIINKNTIKVTLPTLRHLRFTHFYRTTNPFSRDILGQGLEIWKWMTPSSWYQSPSQELLPKVKWKVEPLRSGDTLLSYEHHYRERERHTHYCRAGAASVLMLL